MEIDRYFCCLEYPNCQDYDIFKNISMKLVNSEKISEFYDGHYNRGLYIIKFEGNYNPIKWIYSFRIKLNIIGLIEDLYSFYDKSTWILFEILSIHNYIYIQKLIIHNNGLLNWTYQEWNLNEDKL